MHARAWSKPYHVIAAVLIVIAAAPLLLLSHSSRGAAPASSSQPPLSGPTRIILVVLPVVLFVVIVIANARGTPGAPSRQWHATAQCTAAVRDRKWHAHDDLAHGGVHALAMDDLAQAVLADRVKPVLWHGPQERDGAMNSERVRNGDDAHALVRLPAHEQRMRLADGRVDEPPPGQDTVDGSKRLGVGEIRDVVSHTFKLLKLAEAAHSTVHGQLQC